MIHRSQICALVLASLAGTASADVVVEVLDSGTWKDAESFPSPTPYASVDGSGNVTISSSSADAVFRVYTDTPASESIGVVTVNVSTVSTVLIGDGATGLLLTTALSDACVDWGGLDGTHSANVVLQAAVSGDITGDISADRIFRLDIGADLLGDVVVDGAFTTAFNNIGLVLVDGDILGDVEATGGTIGTVFADGDIGSTTNTVLIYAGADVSGEVNEEDRETIKIIAADNIYADIVASVAAADEGRFRRILANSLAQSDGFPSGGGTAGVIAGLITTYDAEIRGTGSPAKAIPCINAGAVSADILFFDEPMTPISIDSLTADGVIRIGDELADVIDPADSGSGDQTSMIFIRDTGGLKGQIIVNHGGSGDWATDGEIGIGSDPWDPAIRLKPSGSGDNIAP